MKLLALLLMASATLAFSQAATVTQYLQHPQLGNEMDRKRS
jgi:hypothetical protein